MTAMNTGTGVATSPDEPHASTSGRGHFRYAPHVAVRAMRLLLSRCTLDPRHPLDPKALDAHNRTAFDYIEAHLRLEGHTPDEFAALRACREVLVLCGGLRHIAVDAKGAAA